MLRLRSGIGVRQISRISSLWRRRRVLESSERHAEEDHDEVYRVLLCETHPDLETPRLPRLITEPKIFQSVQRVFRHLVCAESQPLKNSLLFLLPEYGRKVIWFFPRLLILHLPLQPQHFIPIAEKNDIGDVAALDQWLADLFCKSAGGLRNFHVHGQERRRLRRPG